VKSAKPVNPPKSTSELTPAAGDDVASDTQRPAQNKIFIRRDSNGLLRPFDEEGNVCQHPALHRRHREIFEAMETEDLTQKSSMSLTQENPPSAYDQFDIQKIIRDECPSTATPDDDRDTHENLRTQYNSLHSRLHASTRTQSTAHTYEENDPRYIKLDFDPAPAGAEDEDENVSQDASFAGLPIEPQNGHSDEPQTPAPPINPFGRKGSVLKPSQMFGATQPSSIGRHLTSPTSSRPSPDVYNDFSSPPKRRRLASSPLGARADDTSPLQSSVRNILTRSRSTDFQPATVPRTSGIQSFDTGPRIQRTNVHEPQRYLSMQESQERRNKDIGNESDTDSDGSDSSIEARPRKRKMEREQLIRQELSTVGRMPSSSSRPASATSAIVEVPSTSRRRSWQEEYIAQCYGWDVRDPQQDDIVADSQAGPDPEEPLERPEDDLPLNNVEPSQAFANAPSRNHVNESRDSQEQNAHGGTDMPAALSDISPPLNQQSEPHSELKLALNASDATGNALPEPSLPLQELSSNRNDLQTPMANKNQIFSDGSETVPETSPPEQRLRPMGEIASISFREGDDEMMANIPGFTQDIEFDNAMRMRSSPQPPPRTTATRKDHPPEPAPVYNAATVTRIEVATGALDRPLPTGPENPEFDTSTNSEQTAAVKEMGDDNDVQAPPGQTELMEANEPQNQQSNNPMLASDTEKSKPNQNVEDIPKVGEKTDPVPESTSTARKGLRSKNELKGPSRALRRSGSTPRSNNLSSHVSKQTTTAKASGLRPAKGSSAPSETISTPVGTPLPLPAEKKANAAPFTRSTRRKSAVALADKECTLASVPGKHTLRRKSAVTVVDDDDSVVLTRSSKRQSAARITKEGSEDPLALPGPSTAQIARMQPTEGLFAKMAFAVSYVKREREKDDVTKLIVDNGGQILQDGFEELFEASNSRPQESDAGLSLSAMYKPLGFSALIADEHSRKAKYMQALALGLPCISGHWILACVAKSAILDWSPYLLCAGQSSFLGNAIKSRTLQPYSAAESTLETTLEGRDKLLNGKSVLMVTGRGKSEDRRKAYVFLTRALGPGRVGQVVGLPEAQKKLIASESEGQTWDLLYVDTQEETAATIVFGSATNSSGASRKRKRGPTVAEDSATPLPKRIRVISDETMIQSLILGQLLED
jgi:hypothetical protein